MNTKTPNGGPLDVRFTPVPLAAARWMVRNVTHTETPPDAVLVMELGALLVSGDLPSWSQNELAGRWRCGRGVVRRIASMLANQYRTMTGPASDHYRTTLRECFRHLASVDEPRPNHDRTTTEPTRARSTPKSKTVEVEVDPTSPSAPDPVPYAEMVVWLSAHMPGKAHVTSKRRPKLRKIWNDHGRETLEALGRWLASKQHSRVRYLVEKSYGIETVIRHVDEYVEAMEAGTEVNGAPVIDGKTSRQWEMAWLGREIEGWQLPEAEQIRLIGEPVPRPTEVH
jgi:hypothetical protein